MPARLELFHNPETSPIDVSLVIPVCFNEYTHRLKILGTTSNHGYFTFPGGNLKLSQNPYQVAQSEIRATGLVPNFQYIIPVKPFPLYGGKYDFFPYVSLTNSSDYDSEPEILSPWSWYTPNELASFVVAGKLSSSFFEIDWMNIALKYYFEKQHRKELLLNSRKPPSWILSDCQQLHLKDMFDKFVSKTLN